MAKLDQFEVLSILGSDAKSTSYKVKNKDTSEVFVWKAFAYNNHQERQQLIQHIEKSLQQEGSNSLHIYDYYVYEDKKIVYITCEFCINGNLANIVQTCRAQNFYIDEEFLWRLVYQLAFILKNEGVLEIKLNDVFLDADFNLKLFRFNVQKRNNLALVMNELCKFGAPHYSDEFNDLIKFITIGNNSVDAILCHPKVLSKNSSNKIVITQIYVKNPIDDCVVDGIDRVRLENVKNRELALKNLEDKLKIKEYEVHKREKKVALQERIVREKIGKADLYLNRCRTSNKSVKSSYDNIDTSFSADCGDPSIVAPTSKKLNGDIIKPASFTRTASERRVHFKGFKGHSPLKEISWTKAETTSVGSLGSKKSLFGKPRPLLENNRPISWTEETKQHAFDLLRIMNKEDVENLPVKHTYL